MLNFTNDVYYYFRGNNVLNTKSELQKALQKHNDKKVLKEMEKERLAQLTPLQKAIDERAQKIEQVGVTLISYGLHLN